MVKSYYILENIILKENYAVKYEEPIVLGNKVKDIFIEKKKFLYNDEIM